jgi:hypothetical protein
MAKLLDIVEGWTGELGPFTLKADGTAVDLTGMTVELILKDLSGTVVTTSGDTRVHGTPTTGQVYYQPDAADMTSAASPYSVHWKVTDGSGYVVFFPNSAADTIVVFKP